MALFNAPRHERYDRQELLQILRMLAPGKPLREALENILRARTGGLIVLTDDDDETLAQVISGGFPVAVGFSPGLLYELGKMDGAIVLDAQASRVRYANVQLVPDASIPSTETGIRHRSAERTARQTGALVIAISQRRDVVTVYRHTLKYQLQDLSVVLAKANQALQTLEKYSAVLAESLNQLSALEFQDLATLHDVAVVLRRVELALRVSAEIDFYMAELGGEGRLLGLQREELVGDAHQEGLLVVRDYLHPKSERAPNRAYEELHALGPDRVQPVDIVRVLGYPVTANVLETFVSPSGYRALSKVPRLPASVVDKVVDRFGSLQRLLVASTEELDEVEGVGEARAEAIRQGLRRQQEQLLLDRGGFSPG